MSHLKCVWTTENATASDSIAQWTMGAFNVDTKDAGEGKRDKQCLGSLPTRKILNTLFIRLTALGAYQIFGP